MNADLTRLALRRAVLVAEAAEQRAALGRHLEPWRRPLTLASRGLSVIRSVASHPAWLIGGALLPTAVNPGRVGAWFRRGLLAVELLRRLRPARSRGSVKN